MSPLEKRFREVERKLQAYQAQPDLNNILRLSEALEAMDEEVGRITDEEEEAANVN